ncbi:MAG: hypothetical protein GX904_04825 [Acholeplasmataceae bacterium]|jgi:hypothetical protein|nr:hypothetical protein [Acholeplasmataceae bacterium]
MARQKTKLAERVIIASRASRVAKLSRFGIIVSALLTFVVFAISFYGEVVGNFTFRVSRRDFQAGISLYNDPDNPVFSPRLNAEKVTNADAMTQFCGTEDSHFDIGEAVCLPSDAEVSSVNGSNNGQSYLAYTFYLTNQGTSAVDLKATATLISATRGAEEAIRLRLIVNDEGTTYAKVQSQRGKNPGEPEPKTVPWSGEYEILNVKFPAFKPNDVIKITVMLWYEGEDPDHNNDIIGGGVKMDMEFNVTYVYDDDELPTTT